MAPTTKQRSLRRRAETVASSVLAGLILTSCGGSASKHPAGATASLSPAGTARADAVVVRVGTTPITGAIYDHWMTIGAATVEEPKPTGLLPKPVAYDPPDFAACVAHLSPSAPRSVTTAQLRVRCQDTYKSIQNRILGFLITGYWLRGEAGEEHVSVTEAAVRKKFEEERRANYPTAASFARLREASRQTVPDLMFAVETRMLSSKLLEKFTGAHSLGKSEQAAITAFNRSIGNRWRARTDCEPGYVIPDCKQFRR